MCERRTVNAPSISQSIPRIPDEDVVWGQVSQMEENQLKSTRIQQFVECIDINCLQDMISGFMPHSVLVAFPQDSR